LFLIKEYENELDATEGLFRLKGGLFDLKGTTSVRFRIETLRYFKDSLFFVGKDLDYKSCWEKVIH
jgi:hypothetical protein